MDAEKHKATVEPIAVIGMQGRFPDAPTIERFWQNLQEGVESLRPFTDDEVKAAGVDDTWTKMPGFVPAARPRRRRMVRRAVLRLQRP